MSEIADNPPYTTIIGLEVHVQLLTASKLFSRASTRFGAPPNTLTSVVDIGLPGVLPVMNRRAFELALRAAVALNCEIPAFTKWDRKHYYYPDLPKGYQISQYDLPMSKNGWLEISDPKGAFAPKRVGVIRAHLEEDAGKSLHDEAAGKADSRIDLNRVGVPLLEIVSAPDMCSAAEAKAYLKELKLLLSYLEVSDCNMQEGSLRVDANVNLRVAAPAGPVATPIVEIKNMNSFSAVERALTHEVQRQYQVWLETKLKKGDVPKQTRGWDDQKQVTFAQRSKEESSDYRYFPEPDLVPVRTTPEQVAAARRALGELPAEIRQRLQTAHGVDAYTADVIVNGGRPLVAYFEALAQAGQDGKRAGNWVLQDVLRVMNERKWTIEQFPLTPEALGELLRAIADGALDTTRAREVFTHMLDSGQRAAEALRTLGIQRVDASALVELCREIVARFPKIAQDVKGGKTQAVGRLVGEARKTNANVDPNQARAVLLEIIDKL